MIHCVSMRLLKIRSHGQLMNRLFSNTNINRCSSKSLSKQDIDDSKQIIKSVKYPDYKVIYTYPGIKYVSVLNLAKRNQSIFFGVSILASTGAWLLNMISTDLCLSYISGCGLITISIHVVTLMCNNMIGHVYLRNNDESVIFAYTNYWGKRVDLTTDIDSILPLSEIPLNPCSQIYRVLYIKNCKEKLKLANSGRKVQKEHFINIFGM
ncbi:transmembrane protein 186 [Megalopta genalis]|uniref:transmembrane protein 186 n=1 Tax=Megalopta genalis TaxID=115081 RepID=UPI003FD058C2